ncbi:Chloroperoxidase [Trichoderma velutinum]
MRGLFFTMALGSLATALPNFPAKGHEWIPAGPRDSRSPCPGLNVLANHGYLPRSGKNIDLPTLQAAVSGGFGYVPDTFDFVFAGALACHLSSTGNSSTFSLSDLANPTNGHECVEFDGSLSRNDLYFGDNLHFDPKIWATMSKRLGLNDPKSKYLTADVAEAARVARVADAKKANPKFNASALEMMGSPGTTALYLNTLTDKNGNVPKEWVKTFFEWERLPFTTPPMTGKTLG